MAMRTILMVEGPDDEHVVKHICGTRQLGEIDHIATYGGVDRLIESIGVRLKESDVSAVGVLVDADTDLDARWQAVTARLAQAGYADLPQQPPPDGLVVRPPASTVLPRVGVWVMPNNRLPGILEDFLRFLVPQKDQLFECVKSALDGLDGRLVRFPIEKKPKALIHSWLAYQAEPGKPLGQAISARYLDSNVAEASDFCGWLRRMFFFAKEGSESRSE